MEQKEFQILRTIESLQNTEIRLGIKTSGKRKNIRAHQKRRKAIEKLRKDQSELT